MAVQPVTHRLPSDLLFLLLTHSVHNLFRLECDEAERSPHVLYFVKRQVDLLNLYRQTSFNVSKDKSVFLPTIYTSLASHRLGDNTAQTYVRLIECKVTGRVKLGSCNWPTLVCIE